MSFPLFVQHAGERTDHSSSGPRLQLSISWGLGGQDLVQRLKKETVCTALRPRALVRQALLRDRAEEPAVGAHPSSLTPTPYPGPSSSLRRAPLTALLGLTPVRLLTQIKALAQGLYQKSSLLHCAPRQLNVPRISPHRQQGQVALRQFCRWWHCEPYPIGVA